MMHWSRLTIERYHFHLHLNSQMCNLLHLIMAMVVELGLNKASPKAPKPGFGRLGYFGNAGSVPDRAFTAASRQSTTKTLEERRTFLGCFFLTST